MTIPAHGTQPPWLTAQQLIDRWDGTTQPASRTTLSRWRRLGVGPEFIRAGRGGKVFYDLASILDHEHDHNVLNLQ